MKLILFFHDKCVTILKYLFFDNKLLTEVEGVPPDGARTITLLSIGDDVDSVENVAGGTIIRSLSLLFVSAKMNQLII